MRLLPNLHVKGKPAVLPDRAIRGQSGYFIYRPCISVYPYHWNSIVPKTPESFNPDRMLPGNELKMYENVVLGGTFD